MKVHYKTLAHKVTKAIYTSIRHQLFNIIMCTTKCFTTKAHLLNNTLSAVCRVRSSSQETAHNIRYRLSNLERLILGMFDEK